VAAAEREVTLCRWGVDVRGTPIVELWHATPLTDTVVSTG
jgi:hypothetical protein